MLIIVATCNETCDRPPCQIILDLRKVCHDCPLRTGQDAHFALQTEKDPCHTGPKDRQTMPPASPSES